jgi:Cft2 family RNA processing exonuclease
MRQAKSQALEKFGPSMSNGSGSLRLISGVGAKSPACFLVETGGKRLMLDLGEGPPPGLFPHVEDIGTIDALILSHGHKDHVGGMALLPKLGNPPVYATDIVARGLPMQLEVRSLPVAGKSEILGIAVETGRNGHAPGGIWLRFSIGGGLLYTGDISAESFLYAYDAPAQPTATVLMDCSYGDYQKPIAECWSKLAAFAERGPLLLPVPANGRGPEIALEFFRHGRDDIFVDEAMQTSLQRLADSDAVSLRPGLGDEIKRLADSVRPIESARGIMLAASADGASGASAKLLAEWEHEAEPAIVLTGYVSPSTPADHLAKSGRAQTMRWNVHPRLSDSVALARATQAKTIIPAFCDRAYLPALATALAPAGVTMDRDIVI